MTSLAHRIPRPLKVQTKATQAENRLFHQLINDTMCTMILLDTKICHVNEPVDLYTGGM